MVDKLGVDSEVHELKLGKSFTKDPVGFHSIRYDFKPASVDTTKMASVEIEENHSVSVTVPHVESSGTTHTVYKGNKRPLTKECVLIIDHQTGEITLEKLTNNLQLKKTRMEGARPRPLTPSEQVKSKPSPKTSSHSSSQPSSQPSSQSSSQPSSQPSSQTLATMHASKDRAVPPVEEMSGSSSESGSLSSDSENDEEETTINNTSQKSGSNQSISPTKQPWPRNRNLSLLRDDLNLSESGSDSD